MSKQDHCSDVKKICSIKRGFQWKIGAFGCLSSFSDETFYKICKQIEAVNYFRKNFHHRCSKGS